MLFSHEITYLELPAEPPVPTAFERFLGVLDGKMPEPASYGLFHWFWIVLVVLACVFVAFKCTKQTDKQVSAVLCAVAGTLLFLELYKQLNFAYDPETGEWAYDWAAFPFQFCSSPMYVLLAAGLLKRGKLRDMLYAFSATYGLFAGTLVMLYPSCVFTETIGINIQTMVHHGAMIVTGVYLYASGRAKIDHKTVVHGAPVFAALLLVALVMNAVYAAVGDPEQNFNMFYLSPSGSTPLAFLDTLFDVIPYPIILIGYAGGFTAAGWATTACAMLAVKLRRRYARTSKNDEIASDGENVANEEKTEIKESL